MTHGRQRWWSDWQSIAADQGSLEAYYLHIWEIDSLGPIVVRRLGFEEAGKVRKSQNSAKPELQSVF